METIETLSAYELGTRAIVGGFLPTVVTPGEVLARENEIDGRFAALAQEVESSAVRPLYKVALARLCLNWGKFYADNQSWTDRFFSGADLMNQLDRWDAQYANAYEGFRRELAAVGAPPPATPGPPPPDPNSPAGLDAAAKRPSAPTPIWLWGVLGIAGVFSAGYLIRAVRS